MLQAILEADRLNPGMAADLVEQAIAVNVLAWWRDPKAGGRRASNRPGECRPAWEMFPAGRSRFSDQADDVFPRPWCAQGEDPSHGVQSRATLTISSANSNDRCIRRWIDYGGRVLLSDVPNGAADSHYSYGIPHLDCVGVPRAREAISNPSPLATKTPTSTRP